MKEATTAASKSVDQPPAAVPAGAEAPSTSKSSPVKEATTAASKSVDTISITSDKMDVSKSIECQSTIKDIGVLRGGGQGGLGPPPPKIG